MFDGSEWSTPNTGKIHTLCPTATRAGSEAGILFQFSGDPLLGATEFGTMFLREPLRTAYCVLKISSFVGAV